jgi:AraC family transcriptional regulator, regulatory protein of adaptative response / methylated-DNA-[protein]-cysteine methyltransferase
MSPSNAHQKNAPVGIQFTVSQCTLGHILVAQSPQGVCAIFLGDGPEILIVQLEKRFPYSSLIETTTGLAHLVRHVADSIENPVHEIDLPLDMRGTAFQQSVWRALCSVPAGQTATYTEIAKYIGAPKSARAVAKACAANTLALVVPCHRILRSDGALSGYRWGVERKRQLLRNELGSAHFSVQ